MMNNKPFRWLKSIYLKDGRFTGAMLEDLILLASIVVGFQNLLSRERNPADGFFGVPDVKDPEFSAGNIFLDDLIAGAFCKIVGHRIAVLGNGDAFSALSLIGFQDNGIGKRMALHKGFHLGECTGWGGGGGDSFPAGNVGVVCAERRQNIRFGFPHKTTGGHAGVAGGEGPEIPMTYALFNDVPQDGGIYRPRRPEFPAREPFPFPVEQAPAAFAAEGQNELPQQGDDQNKADQEPDGMFFKMLEHDQHLIRE